MNAPQSTTMLPAFVAKTMRDCPAFRIAEGESNYFVMVFDDVGEQCGLVAVVEVFDVGGKTPPNQHLAANEYFFVLHGHGRARVGGEVGGVWKNIAKGDALLVRPGVSHVVENLGTERLYCLTLMVPDEGFAALIRSGIPVQLDDADRAVLGAMAD
jgi:mannose-6-phosphate isomerase-like protein (cupin superfamily)